MPGGYTQAFNGAAAMGLSEADTRARLIDPAIHARGRTEDLIRREETAGAIEIIDGRPFKQAEGRTDYPLRSKPHPDSQPVEQHRRSPCAVLRAEIKRKLLDDCDLWCIVSMPPGVFSKAGAGVKASLLFFNKGRPTERIWYHDLSDLKIDKNTPFTLARMEDFFELVGDCRAGGTVVMAANCSARAAGTPST